MVQYKLNYFNMRGRGELLRLIFVAAGQEFMDNRIEHSNWPSLKATAPFGQLPYLEILGSKSVKIAQSMTIARFLSKKFGLAGKDELEQAHADMYADQLSDLLTELGKAHWEKDEAKKKEMMDKLHNETVPNHMKLYEKRLTDNNGHFAGAGITYADLYLMVILEWFGDKKEEMLQHFPKIKALDHEIRNHPKVKVYLEKRPKTDH